MSYFSRWLGGPLEARASRGKVRMLYGARQVGKSTLLRHAAGPDALTVDLQDPRERFEMERRPGVFASRLEALPAGRTTVAVDEIQKVPALLEEIQFLVDRHPKRFDFFVTGSSARKLRTRSANLLPGRAHVFELFPLVSAERREAAPSRAFRVSLGDEPPGFPAARLEDRLVFGDLPGVATEAPAARQATLAGYAGNYLEQEIRQEALVRDVGSFSAFLAVAAERSGAVVNLAAISRTTGVAASTLKAHYDVLIDTFVGYWIPPYSASVRRKVQTSPKFTFFDLGVRNAVAQVPLDKSLLATAAGPLFVQLVQLELLRRCRYLGPGHRVAYWRTFAGREVDIVLVTPEETVPIEVKWTDRPQSTDARHVEAFLDEFPKHARRGLVACRVPHAMKLSERVTAIPAAEL